MNIPDGDFTLANIQNLYISTEELPLYTITLPFVFTNASATGQNGPTLSAVQSAYSSTGTWSQNTSYLNMTTQGIQLWTVPKTGKYQIIAGGAGGGNNTAQNSIGGRGVVTSSTVSLTKGQVVKIIAGQLGGNYSAVGWGGGGGGTFVLKEDNTPLLISGAGGGGGNTSVGPGIDAVVTTSGTNGGGGVSCPGGTNGNGAPTTSGGGAGGGGLLTNAGGNGGKGVVSGNAIGLSLNAWFLNAMGGFGCGGVGGGGYSGGGGVQSGGQLGGGGGGSYDINGSGNVATLYTGTLPASITTVASGYNTGHGFVVINTIS